MFVNSSLRTFENACPYNISTNTECSRFVVNFKPCKAGRRDKIKGYGVVLARKPYPFILFPAHVVGVKFTRNLHRTQCPKVFAELFSKSDKNLSQTNFFYLEICFR